MARTYKELQDEVLKWMADSDDEGLMRELVKVGIDRSHKRILTSEMFDFMIWPQTIRMDVLAGQQMYNLHPEYLQGLYFYNPTTKEYLEEIPIKQLMESEEDGNDGTLDEPERFMLTTVVKVQQQPPTAGAVTVTTSGGNESAQHSVIVSGIDENGNSVQETLSSGGSWNSIVGSTNFMTILDITKVGEGWTRSLTFTASGVTVLTLGATEYGKEFRQFELLKQQTSNATVLYRFYKRPRSLVNDNDIPDLPAEFDELLVLETLLNMQGYARATQDELRWWTQNRKELMDQMKMTFQQGRTLGARPRFVRWIPRI